MFLLPPQTVIAIVTTVTQTTHNTRTSDLRVANTAHPPQVGHGFSLGVVYLVVVHRWREVTWYNCYGCRRACMLYAPSPVS
jgi:hypothetical protein